MPHPGERDLLNKDSNVPERCNIQTITLQEKNEDFTVFISTRRWPQFYLVQGHDIECPFFAVLTSQLAQGHFKLRHIKMPGENTAMITLA